jgi:hypothetical protein
MIKPEQIPDEVVRVINEACDSGRAWNARDTLAAAINAWPNIEKIYRSEDETLFTIMLPLTQENNNGSD